MPPMPTLPRRPRLRSAAAGSPTPHEPRRTCVGCRAVRPQRQLVRLVGDGWGGVAVASRRARGRGAYLCPLPGCLDAALRRRVLPRALRVELPRLDAAALRQQVATEASRRDVGWDGAAGPGSRRPY
jgi:predicted RNA-binding protein YlxR (DUF448 family)